MSLAAQANVDFRIQARLLRAAQELQARLVGTHQESSRRNDGRGAGREEVSAQQDDAAMAKARLQFLLLLLLLLCHPSKSSSSITSSSSSSPASRARMQHTSKKCRTILLLFHPTALQWEWLLLALPPTNRYDPLLAPASADQPEMASEARQ